MAGQTSTLDPGKTQVRYGSQQCPGVPATLLPFHLRINTETVVNTPASIQPEGLGGTGMQQRALPGPFVVGGDIVLEVNAEDVVPILLQIQEGASVVDTTPVFTTIASPLETAIDWNGVLFTFEFERDDGFIQRVWDVKASVAFDATAGALLLATLTLQASLGDYWGDPLIVGPTATLAPAAVIGFENFGAWNGQTGPLEIRLESIKVATGPTDPLTMQVVAKKGPEVVLTDTWDINGTTTVTPTGAGAPEAELADGDYVEIDDALHQVASRTIVAGFITTFELTAAHANTDTGLTIVETFGPTESTLPKGLNLDTAAAQYGELKDSRSGAPFGDLTTHDEVEMFLHEKALTNAAVPATTLNDEISLSGSWDITLSTKALNAPGNDGELLTEARVGQRVVIAGEVHRFAAIADKDNATLVKDHVAGTTGATITVSPQWSVAQTRPSFVSAFGESPLMNVLGITVEKDGSPFLVNSVSWTVTPPVVSTPVTGQKRPSLPVKRGNRVLELTMSREAIDGTVIIEQETSREVSVKVVAIGPLLIAGSSPATQYRMEFFFGNSRHTAPRHTVTSPTERPEEITLVPGEDPGGTFPEDAVFTFTNTLDAATQTPATPLVP
jgi:hypothetical protein